MSYIDRQSCYQRMSHFVVNAGRADERRHAVDSPRREALGALWLPATWSLSSSPPEISRISTLHDELSRLRLPSG